MDKATSRVHLKGLKVAAISNDQRPDQSRCPSRSLCGLGPGSRGLGLCLGLSSEWGWLPFSSVAHLSGSLVLASVAPGGSTGQRSWLEGAGGLLLLPCPAVLYPRPRIASGHFLQILMAEALGRCWGGGHSISLVFHDRWVLSGCRA